MFQTTNQMGNPRTKWKVSGKINEPNGVFSSMPGLITRGYVRGKQPGNFWNGSNWHSRVKWVRNTTMRTIGVHAE